MKKIQVTLYRCEFCNKVFKKKSRCLFHEKENHKCPECKHVYYVYGCELNCIREDEGKRCKFERK